MVHTIRKFDTVKTGVQSMASSTLLMSTNKPSFLTVYKSVSRSYVPLLKSGIHYTRTENKQKLKH